MLVATEFQKVLCSKTAAGFFIAFLLTAKWGAPATQPDTRQPAPVFSLYDSHGKKRNLSEFRGRVVLINFWATWCAPCRVEIPWLKQVQDRYAKDGFTVLGVAMDQAGWRSLTPFLAQYKVNYPVLLGDVKIARLYRVRQVLPKTFFLDRKGRIVAVHNAILSPTSLDRIIRVLLSEKD